MNIAVVQAGHWFDSGASRYEGDISFVFNFDRSTQSSYDIFSHNWKKEPDWWRWSAPALNVKESNLQGGCRFESGTSHHVRENLKLFLFITHIEKFRYQWMITKYTL
jgi:hypothetical protein